MSYQTGVLLYGFLADRLDERMRAQYPDGRAAYRDDWQAAHDLAHAHADAVSAGDDEWAAEYLQGLRAMAVDWDDHPDHPDRSSA